MAWIRLSHAKVRFSSPSICHPCTTYNYHIQRRGLAEPSDNHYDILGLKSSASPSQIKSAYYQLSKKYHPDVAVGVDNTREKFAKVSAAYEVLSSPEKRAVYDRSLHNSTGRPTVLTPDIEYHEFLRRRGTFRARTSTQAARGAWSNYDEFFRHQQQYYGRTMQRKWEAQRNCEHQMRKNQSSKIGALWLYFLLMGMLIFSQNNA